SIYDRYTIDLTYRYSKRTLRILYFISSNTTTSDIYTLSLHDALPISSQFATRRTLFHVLVGCGLLMLKVSRLKLPVIWLLVSMWLNTLTKSQIWTLLLKV